MLHDKACGSQADLLTPIARLFVITSSVVAGVLCSCWSTEKYSSCVVFRRLKSRGATHEAVEMLEAERSCHIFVTRGQTGVSFELNCNTVALETLF